MRSVLGFSAEASLGRAPSQYRGGIIAGWEGGDVRPARIARRTTYGCGMNWHFNEWCCRFWAPGGDIVVCCPRDGSGPCSTYPGLLGAARG